MKARTQFTVAATALVALLVAVTGQLIVWRNGTSDRASLDDALSARAAQIRTTAAKSGSLPTDGVYAVRLMAGSTVRAQTGSPLQFSAPVADGFTTVTASDGTEYRSWAETLKTGVQLQVLVGLRDIQSRHARAVRVVDLAVIVAMLVTALLMWLVGGVILRPLRRLQQGARELSPDDPGGRLPAITDPAEISDVAASVNAMLDSLENSSADDRVVAERARRQDAEDELAAVRAELADTLAHTVGGQDDLALVRTELSGAQGTLSETESELAEAESALAEARSSLAGSEEELAAARAETERSQTELAAARTELLATKDSLADTQALLASAEGEIATVRAELSGPAADREELVAALERLGADLEALLDNPGLSTTQRHLVLAGIQAEYRRVVVLATGVEDEKISETFD